MWHKFVILFKSDGHWLRLMEEFVNGIKALVKSSCYVNDIYLSFLPNTRNPFAKERCELRLKTNASELEYSISCGTSKIYIHSKFSWDSLENGLGEGLRLMCSALDAWKSCRMAGISTAIQDVGPDSCCITIKRMDNENIRVVAMLPPDEACKNLALYMICTQFMEQLIRSFEHVITQMHVSEAGDTVKFYLDAAFSFDIKYNSDLDEGTLICPNRDGPQIEKKFNLRTLYTMARVVRNAYNA